MSNGGQGLSAQRGVEWSVVKWVTSGQGQTVPGAVHRLQLSNLRGQTIPGQTGVGWSVVK